MHRFNKAGFLSGICATLLLFVAGFFGNAAGGPPSPYQASAGALADYYLANAHSTVIAGILSLFAVVLLAVFAAALWVRFCDFDQPAVRGWTILGLIGTGIFGAVTVVVSLVEISIAGLAQANEPELESIRTLAALWSSGVLGIGLAAVPMLGGFGLAGLAAPAYARWLAWLAVVGAVAGLLSVLPDAVAPASLVTANLLGLIGQLVLPALYFWMFGASFGIKRTEVFEDNDEQE